MARTRTKRLLTDAQWAKIEPLLPKLKRSKLGGRPWADNRAVLDRDFVGLTNRRALAGSARPVPKPLDVLAAAALMGRTGRLGDHLADVSRHLGRAQAAPVE